MKYYTSDCDSDVCSLVCPKCNKTVEYEHTLRLGQEVHCCLTNSEEVFCLIFDGETDE